MLRQFTFLFLFFFFVIHSYSQNKPSEVKLVEERDGKKLHLYAENKGGINYVVFLRVITTDFRRSGNRPILKEIPANSKQKLITLIQLANTAGAYEAEFIVNETQRDLRVQKDYTSIKEKVDAIYNPENISLFTQKFCDLCNETRTLFKQNKIDFDEFSSSSAKLDSLLASKNKIKQEVSFPVLAIKDSVYTAITNKQEVIKILKSWKN